jgi:sulfur carrier protein ThiS
LGVHFKKLLNHKKEVKMAQVKVGRLPGRIQEVEVGENAGVAEVLAKAELTADGYELRLNGSPAEMMEKVGPGDTILLVKKIKAN